LEWTKFKLGAGILSNGRVSIIEIITYVFSAVPGRSFIGNFDANVKPEDSVVTALDLMMAQDLICDPLLIGTERL